VEEKNLKEAVLSQFPKQDKEDILKSFPKKGAKSGTLFMVVASLFVVLAGVGTGWLLSGKSFGKTAQTGERTTVTQAEKSDKEAGISDESEFPDTAEGTLVEGGIENEGTHHLERQGGPSQNVYLSSTVIDLQSYVGKKVKIWGQTLSGQKAGWLMDVGKIKILD